MEGRHAEIGFPNILSDHVPQRGLHLIEAGRAVVAAHERGRRLRRARHGVGSADHEEDVVLDAGVENLERIDPGVGGRRGKGPIAEVREEGHSQAETGGQGAARPTTAFRTEVVQNHDVFHFFVSQWPLLENARAQVCGPTQGLGDLIALSERHTP